MCGMYQLSARRCNMSMDQQFVAARDCFSNLS
jgi:hypothetical protein